MPVCEWTCAHTATHEQRPEAVCLVSLTATRQKWLAGNRCAGVNGIQTSLRHICTLPFTHRVFTYFLFQHSFVYKCRKQAAECKSAALVMGAQPFYLLTEEATHEDWPFLHFFIYESFICSDNPRKNTKNKKLLGPAADGTVCLKALNSSCSVCATCSKMFFRCRHNIVWKYVNMVWHSESKIYVNRGMGLHENPVYET